MENKKIKRYKMNNEKLIGKTVKIVKDSIIGNRGQFIGKAGVVTSVGNATLPIHVTLEGQKFETDFRVEELEVLQ
jgi:hypothetical protein